MDVGGAPLKPWEVARIGQSQNTTAETAGSPEKNETSQGITQTTTPTPNYTPYTRYSSYSSPYQTPGAYGGSYYGYPSSYGTGMYGSNYGSMYNYGRPAPWTQHHLPGMVPQPSDIPPKPAMWQRFLDGLQKVAFHFFITALLAFLDKAGSLYGEIARFVIKLLGFGRRSKRTLTAGQSARAVEAKVGATEIFKTIWKTNGKVQDT